MLSGSRRKRRIKDGRVSSEETILIKTYVIMNDQKKDLTLKQRKWLSVYLEKGNATEAAMQSYDCKGDREVAANIGYENLRKLDYTDFMEVAGVTDKLLQEKLLEGLGATKQLGARKIIQQSRGMHEIKAEATSETDDFIEVEDYAIRHKYLETALRLKKRLDNNDEQPNPTNILVLINTAS